MFDETILIAKNPGIKKCVRINKEEDIPDFLREIVKIYNGELLIYSLESLTEPEKVPLGSVIAYEELDDGKMNAWNKANYKETTKEVDGVFYEIPKIKTAVPLSDNMPEEIISLFGDKLSMADEDTFQIKSESGLLMCDIGEGYLVVDGKTEKGEVDGYFLSKNTPSFKEYNVVDKEGNIIETLEEYDLKLRQRVLTDE